MDGRAGLIWRVPVLGDAGALGRLHHQAWVDAYGDRLPSDRFERWTVADAVAKWEGILRAPEVPDQVRLAVFADDSEAVAWIVVGAARPLDDLAPVRARELWGIYLAREQYGTGLAHALVDHLLGDDPAQLWVAERNARAEAFYRKVGFERDGAHATHEPSGLLEVRMVR